MNATALCVVALLLAASPAGARTLGGDEVLHHDLDAGPTTSPFLPAPILRAPQGAAVVGGPFSLVVEGGLPFQTGALVFSPVEAPFFDPSYGVTFHFGLPYDTILFTTDLWGDSPPLVAVDPIDVSLCGAFAIFQAGVFDPTSSGGLAVTNAIRLRVGVVTRPVFEPAVEDTPVPYTDIAYGDVDGDGLDDALLSWGFLHVRLGQVGGGFAAPLAYGFLTSSDLAPVLGDLDGDGETDLVAVNTASASVSTLLLDAALAVKSSGSFSTVVDPTDLALGDFDLSGSLDIVVSRTGVDHVGLLSGVGDGTFAAVVDVDVGGTQVQIEVADLDENGAPDFVTSAAATVVALGNGDGTFAVAPGVGPGAPLFSLAIGDVDDNGDLDVVGFAGSTLALQLGNGDGTLQSWLGRSASTILKDLVLADLDGDDQLEAIALTADPILDSVLVSDFAVNFGPFTEYGCGVHEPLALDATDADQDGAVDVVVIGQDSVNSPTTAETVATLRGQGNGQLLALRSVPVTPSFQAAIADVDDDGRAELLLTNGASGLDIWAVTDSGTTLLYELGGAGDVLVADFDGDGATDVMSGSRVYPGNALGGGFGPPTGSSVFGHDQVAGRFDGDAIPDVAAVWLGTVSVHPGKGDLTFEPAVFTLSGFTSASPSSLTSGYVDGDGHLDLVVSDTLSLTVLLGAGDGTFADLPPIAVSDARRIELADVDRDGDQDLVWLEQGFPDELTVALGFGDGTFAGTQSIPVGTWVEGFALADFDGDGATDAMVADRQTGDARLYTGNGDGTFTPSIELAAGTTVTGLVAGDLDGDDLPDFAALDQGVGRAWVSVNRVGE